MRVDADGTEQDIVFLIDNGCLLYTSNTGDGYVKGTNYEGWTYFGNISKVINDHHKLSLTAFGAPQMCIRDRDSREEAERMRRQLFDDLFLLPELVFVSPGGHGVKAFVPYDLGRTRCV